MTDIQEPREPANGTQPPLTAAPAGSLPAALFASWRRVIGGIGAAFRSIRLLGRSLAHDWMVQWRLVREYHASAAEPWGADPKSRNTAAALGIRAFAFGLVLAGIVSASPGGLWLPGTITVGSEVLWAGMRFIIIALLLPPGAITRSRLSVAYLAGLLPYALGATWLLRAAALLASALLTGRGLRGTGVSDGDVRTALGWSFGGQAGILAGGWLFRAILALVVGA